MSDSESRAATAAFERVLVGGNHLGLLIGADHPPYTATHDDARSFYYARNRKDAYEAWCCWRTIMELRDVLEGSPARATNERGRFLEVGNLRISLCDNPDVIAILRGGEGGEFSLKEFHDMVQEFVSDRL